ncbi:MAG: response regulator [Acetobacteraceae bacterium]|nr:response regulator [Acetobacteraceae bacterium]
MPEPCRVLVVEDEGLVALEIETFLTGGGHEVVGTAADRAGALALVRGARPDLALVDRCLSGGDSGLELAADLSALGVSVLFVTGNCPEEEDGGAVARAVGCLHKPFDEGQLLTAVAVATRLARGGPVPAGRLPSGLHLYRV